MKNSGGGILETEYLTLPTVTASLLRTLLGRGRRRTLVTASGLTMQMAAVMGKPPQVAIMPAAGSGYQFVSSQEGRTIRARPWIISGSPDQRNIAMIVHVVAVRMMQLAIVDVIEVIAVLDLHMLVHGGMVVVGMDHMLDQLFGSGMAGVDGKAMLVLMPIMRGVHMAIVQVIDMAFMFDRLVAAFCAVGVIAMVSVDNVMRRGCGAAGDKCCDCDGTDHRVFPFRSDVHATLHGFLPNLFYSVIFGSFPG